MDWFKKHVDTCIILGAFGASILWMNGKFNDVEKEIGNLKTDTAVIKAVLILRNVMPPELASKDQKLKVD